MIYTVTLNPAVDKTIIVKDLLIDHVNRAENIREDAGGKGINVSKMIKNLMGESVALGICAGRTGEFIKSQLEEMGISHHFIEGDGQTRTNIKIVDDLNKTYTDINEPGASVTQEVLDSLEKKIFSHLQKEDYLVLAGSVPASVPTDIYKKWIQRCNEVGAKVILDADKELLENGVQAGPYLIKPNIHELEALCHQKIETIEEAVLVAKELLKYKIEIVVISLGKDGCIVVTKEETFSIGGLTVPVKSTVGAGDSMVAAITYGLSHHETLKDAMILGVAASAASIMQEGTIMGELETIRELQQQIKITM